MTDAEILRRKYWHDKHPDDRLTGFNMTSISQHAAILRRNGAHWDDNVAYQKWVNNEGV